MMNLGGERLDAEFDLVKITKQLRNLKELMREKQLWVQPLKYSIKHTGMNVIKLDSDDEDLKKYADDSELGGISTRQDTVNQVMRHQLEMVDLTDEPLKDDFVAENSKPFDIRSSGFKKRR